MKDFKHKISLYAKLVVRVLRFLVALCLLLLILFLFFVKDWYVIAKLGDGYIIKDVSSDIDSIVAELHYRPALIKDKRVYNANGDSWPVLGVRIIAVDYNKSFIMARTDSAYWLVDKSISFAPVKSDSLRFLGIYGTSVIGPLDSSSFYHLKDSLLVRSKHWEQTKMQEKGNE